MLKVANDTAKNTTKDLKSLVDICQKEDDQKIKLAELELKKQDFAFKKEIKHKELEPEKEKTVEYIAPTFSETVTAEGKVILAKNE